MSTIRSFYVAVKNESISLKVYVFWHRSYTVPSLAIHTPLPISRSSSLPSIVHVPDNRFTVNEFSDIAAPEAWIEDATLKVVPV